MSQHNIIIHKAEDFQKMRQAGSLAAKTLRYIEPFIQPNITTEEINSLCHNFIIANNGIPAPLNYKGFPKSICTSINHVICHGIPSSKKLNDGDIINVDVTVIVDGWHGDTSKTFIVGTKNTILAKRLVQVTYDAMMLAIECVKPGIKLNLIGKLIQEYVESYNFSVVRDYCGHGIGKRFHCEPNVMHYYIESLDTILQEGMFFTIEPMVNVGGYKTKLLHDGWTVVTKDKSLSAQFEHTIGVTSKGYEIFTI